MVSTPGRISTRMVFSTFLVLGALSGFFLGNLRSVRAAEALSAKTPAQTTSLIVVVDDLSAAAPIVQAAWLLKHSPQGEAAWQPVYPAPLASQSAYALPHEAIYLDANQHSSLGGLATLAPLQQAALAFDESLVIDEIGLGTLLGTALALPSTAAEPQAALQAQVQVLQSLCAASWHNEQLDQFVGLMPEHLRSSLNVFTWITRWDRWMADGQPIQCRHPWAS